MPSQPNLFFNRIRLLGRHPFTEHFILWVSIGAVVGVFYRSWFSDGGFTRSVWAAYGREVLGVVIQFYVLVWLLSRYSDKPRYWLPGLLGYYWLTYTYYFATAVLVYDYTSLDDFSGGAYYFIQRRDQYWSTLFTYEALMRLLRFPILITIFPLLLWAIREGYRRQLRNVALQQQNVQLELSYLKSQVNPHFLFNILNGIYALTEEESPRAARLVAQLSGLMRYALYETAEPLVPLARELAFIRDYVALEQTRTGKRLTLEMSLPNRVDEALQIAPFILITFVENAFKHGVATTTRPAWVTLSVHTEGGRLTLHVANSKPVNTSAPVVGVGLRNVQKRLVLLYPGLHTLIVNDEPNQYGITLIIQVDRPIKQ
ncbi:sensor histidine kinase [Spirosoma utsteinense]|uniref:sensor histidine kinase n=1 Tax=Spirosoma utsteinense TaxID=2585773 RepID=UPI001647185F|nr:histidine kinase [Spirosoma utsteinense]MBC3789083.1 hypothetical protein [Spirosoma utsteinense]